ncbi:hypothetical protein L7F22_065792 [Adiantum nelumboides]|nr:hypothetical protein [Adiantum nelumboides]
MRIRKRPASSQCAGATAPRSAAGVVGQVSLKGGNCNPRAQPAAVDYRQLLMPSHDDPFHQVQVNIGVGSAEIACPFSTQELHIHSNDSVSWQQHLQVFINEPGSRQFIGTFDALSAGLLRCPIALPQFDAECSRVADNVSITRHKERLLQTAETCLPVAADNISQSGQVTKSSGNSHPAQIAPDNHASISSFPLLNVDLNRNLKKQASARNIGDNLVNASRQGTARDLRTYLVELQDNLYEQENVMKKDILVTDAQHSKENNCVQDGLDLSGASFEDIAASDSKIQRVSDSCSDDLDLKLAPKSEALPSLVETDMLTKPESPPLENFSFKRRRVDHGVTISEIKTEHLNAIRVFGSSLVSESSSMERSTGISIVIENLDATDDGGDANSIQEHAKSMIHDRTLIKEEPSASNDNSDLQQVPRQGSTLTAEEEETNTISASTEAKEQQQQQQCKRHDGKRWRCSRICVPGTLYCEHHARKQRRSYINQTKAARKHGVEADKAMLKLTGCLQEIHEEPSIKVHQIKNAVKKNVVEPKLQAENKVEVADKCKGQVWLTERVRSGGLQKRCARHDGRGWQCKSKCVAGSVYCEHHKEKLRRNHAKWNAKCSALKHQQTTKISCGAVSTSIKEGLQETAEDDDNQVQRKLPKEQSAIDVLIEHGRPDQSICKAAAGIISAGASGKELESGFTAVEAELDDDHPEENAEASALMSSSCKRKRKLLHDIYARCNSTSTANE